MAPLLTSLQVSDLAGSQQVQDCLLQAVCYYSATSGGNRGRRWLLTRLSHTLFFLLPFSSHFHILLFYSFFNVFLCCQLPFLSFNIPLLPSNLAPLPSSTTRSVSGLQSQVEARVRQGREDEGTWEGRRQGKEEDLSTNDCEVFQCGAARLGHVAFR